MLSHKAIEGGEREGTHSQITITPDESLFFPEMDKYLPGKGQQWINCLFCFACMKNFVLLMQVSVFESLGLSRVLLEGKWTSVCMRLSCLQGLRHKMYLLSTPSNIAQISNRELFVVLNSSLKPEDYQGIQLFYSSLQDSYLMTNFSEFGKQSISGLKWNSKRVKWNCVRPFFAWTIIGFSPIWFSSLMSIFFKKSSSTCLLHKATTKNFKLAVIQINFLT